MDNSVWPAFDAFIFLTREGPGRRVVHLKPKELFFAQGSTARSVFYLHKGRMKLTVVSHAGKEAAIALVSAGDFFGEESLVGKSAVRAATATAVTGCTALQIERKEMLRAVHEEHALSDVFITFLLTRTMRAQADLVDQLFNSSEKRLARLLLLMARHGMEGDPEPLIPPITQETLAEMIGTTRSRVNFFMNRFRKLGFVDYTDRIRVHEGLLTVLMRDDILDDNGREDSIIIGPPTDMMLRRRSVAVQP